MVSTSVLALLRAAPAASDKAASIAARGRTVPVQQSAWILLGMPLPAATAAKHSCATTAKVKILHWGTAQLEMTSPYNVLQLSSNLTLNRVNAKMCTAVYPVVKLAIRESGANLRETGGETPVNPCGRTVAVRDLL